MAEHITDPRVFAGLVVISSGDDYAMISGSESADQEPWVVEFGVKDGKIVVVRDTGEHLSALGVLMAADSRT